MSIGVHLARNEKARRACLERAAEQYMKLLAAVSFGDSAIRFLAIDFTAARKCIDALEHQQQVLVELQQEYAQLSAEA